MEPWQNWVAALTLGGAAVWYYVLREDPTRPKSTRNSIAAEQTQSTNTSKRKVERKTPKVPARAAESVSTGVGIEGAANTPAKQSKRKGTKIDSSNKPAVTVTSQANDAEDDDAAGDREWAQQLNAAKQGINLNASSGSRPNRSRSPAKGSPQSTAAAAGDVSDMLEPAAPGPSSIRITGEAKPEKKNAKKAAEPAQETKKQRQNRKKNEEKKALREEQERDRKVLEEQQRRSAREARGEPAKNGLGAAAPSQNAWTQAGAAKGAANGAVNEGLLDTFDQDAIPTASSNGMLAKNPTAATTDSTFDADLLAPQPMNGDAGWNEVTTKKAKKKNATSTPTPSDPSPALEPQRSRENNFASISTSDLIGGNGNVGLTNGAAKVPSAPTKQQAPPVKNSNPFAALEMATGFTPNQKGHPKDSDWAVE